MTAAQQAARLERRNAALALRPSLSPPGPAPGRLRVATWNLNSLRAWLAAVERFFDCASPDVLCLQETKAAGLPRAAAEMFERHGYQVAHVGLGAFNGVALAARYPIENVRCSGELGDEHLDRGATPG